MQPGPSRNYSSSSPQQTYQYPTRRARWNQSAGNDWPSTSTHISAAQRNYDSRRQIFPPKLQHVQRQESRPRNNQRGREEAVDAEARFRQNAAANEELNQRNQENRNIANAFNAANAEHWMLHQFRRNDALTTKLEGRSISVSMNIRPYQNLPMHVNYGELYCYINIPCTNSDGISSISVPFIGNIEFPRRIQKETLTFNVSKGYLHVNAIFKQIP